jgi:hypothetical protein
MVRKNATLEQKRIASEYNTAWKAAHRTGNTEIAGKIRKKEAYYAARAKEEFSGYCRYFLANVKRRAKLKGIPFNLVVEDIFIPEVCPVFGTPLVKHVGKFNDDSPSLDRIIPAKGYVRGNIAVMSYRANRIKCHATLEDLRAIVRFMEQFFYPECIDGS